MAARSALQVHNELVSHGSNLIWLAELSMCICACRYGLTEEQKAAVETQYTELLQTRNGSHRQSTRDLCGTLAAALTNHE